MNSFWMRNITALMRDQQSKDFSTITRQYRRKEERGKIN
jgi:hypothetical protein